MNREAVATWSLRATLLLVAAALCWAVAGYAATRPREFLYVPMMGFAALVSWAVHVWADKEARFVLPPAAWLAIAFAGYVAWAYAVAPVEYVARGELIRVATYLGLFLLALNIAGRKNSPQWILYPLLAAGVVSCFYGIWQFSTRSGSVLWYVLPGGGSWRASGSFVNANNFAAFLGLLLPLALAHSVAGRVPPAVRILLGYCCLMLLAGLGLSFSRGGWIGAAAGMLVMVTAMLMKPRLRLLAVGIALAISIVSGAFFTKSYFAQRRFQEAEAATADSSLGMRLLIWQTALAQWKTSPLTGIGPGHFDVRYREFKPPTLKSRPEYTHNDYLNTLADYGVIGLLLALGTVALVLLHVIRVWPVAWKNSDNAGPTSRFGFAAGSNRGALLLGGAAALVSGLVHAAFDFNLHIPAIALATVVLMGLLLGQRISNAFSWRFNLPGKLALSAAVLAVIAGGAPVIAHGIAEQRALVLAVAPHESFESHLAAWKAAAAAEPMNAETAHTVGEVQRRQAWRLEDDFRTHATNAIPWFQRAVEINPYDAKSEMAAGMCLDWLKRYDEAAPHYARAIALDPSGFQVLAQAGWHEMQTNNYAKAKELFERSLKVTPWGRTNDTARTYLRIATERLARGEAEWPPKSLLPSKPAATPAPVQK